MEHRPLVIVGSGPAGTASALFLQTLDPQLAGEALIIEKAHHPRPKVCAGGLIPHTLECLRELDVTLSVPNVAVHRARVDIPGRSVSYADRELCRVVRRDEFDASLVHACRQRGVEVREDEKVVDLRRENAGVRIETERGSYHTPIVIGADGSGSFARRRLLGNGPECVGKAVMCDVPIAHLDWSGYVQGCYDFSFVPVRDGLRGYLWVFPCLINGVPHANIGAYSVDAEGSGARLAKLLRERVAALGGTAVPMKSFPIRRYAPGAPLAAPHVMLAGDAAGVDPLMGEGISFAFEYGRRAAAAAAHALRVSDFEFAEYGPSVAQSWMGKKLRRLDMGSRLFYGRLWWLWFGIAAHSRGAQEIGIRWYNGVDGWDQRSGWDAVRAWARGELRPATP
jgi:flavin-dependent dehydrogenase